MEQESIKLGSWRIKVAERTAMNWNSSALTRNGKGARKGRKKESLKDHSTC